MADFKLGSGSIDDLKVGSSQVDAVYMGADKVWPPDPLVLTEYTMSAVGFPIGTVCDQGSAVPHYHDGAGTYPVLGDTTYTDSGGSSPVSGGLQYFKLPIPKYIQIDAAGIVTAEGDCPLVEFTISGAGFNLANVCGESANTQRWHNGAGSEPTVGDTIYEDSAGNTPLPGGNNYFKITNRHLQINGSGVVTLDESCAQPITISSPNSTQGAACSATPSIARWFGSGESFIQVGDVVYSDEALTSPINWGNQWSKTDSDLSIQIDSVGVVLAIVPC